MAASPKPASSVAAFVPAKERSPVAVVLSMLWRDKFATCAVIFLTLALLCALLGPALLRAGSSSSAPTRSDGRCSPASSSPPRTRC